MKKTLILLILLPALVLTACVSEADPSEASQIAEITATEETSMSTEDIPETAAPTEAPAESSPETSAATESHSDEPTIKPLQPGIYVISSVGIDGDISFFSTPDPENGYLLLNEDGTGTMLFDGVEAELTWDGETVIWNGRELAGLCLSYYDDALGYEDVMLMLYFMDTPTSIAFRPLQDAAA